MQSEFLMRVLTTSTLHGGCGMSARPSFYSGRGATISDLNSSKLTRIWTAIQTHVGEQPAAEFVKMVAVIPCLSATDFLLNLARLEANSWCWSADLLGSERGVFVDSELTAWATVGEVLSQRNDETELIRGDFLRARGCVRPRTSTSLGDWSDR